MHQKKTWSAGGIVMYDGAVLLVLENGNFWGFPKGRIEFGESALETACREIAEEAGCRHLNLTRELGAYQRHPFTLHNELDLSELKEITMFLFGATTGELVAPAATNSKGHWVPKEEAASLLTHPEDRAFYGSIENLL